MSSHIGGVIIIMVVFWGVQLTRYFKRRGGFDFNRFINSNFSKSSVSIASASSATLDPLQDKDNDSLLPSSVTERIKRTKQQHLPWTSNLSVSEWTLLKSLKLRPVGMVSGMAHYSISMSIDNWIEYMRTRIYASEAMGCADVLRQTCHKALDRLKEEARLHGAHAVVGIKFIPRWPSRSGHQVEYIATGTAVVMEGREPTNDPILCTTSVIEFAKLIEAGTMPMGIAIGLGIYYHTTSFVAGWRSGSWTNQEITEFSNVTYCARNIAFNHLRTDISNAGGAGVLGYHTAMDVHEVESDDNNRLVAHVIEYKCIGTIIGRVAHNEKAHIKMTLSLQN